VKNFWRNVGATVWILEELAVYYEMLVAILVPTINERENIERLIPLTLNLLSDKHLNGHILIIDDASTDGTPDLAEKLDEGRGRVHVMRRQGKKGLGSAYRDGFRLILDRGYDGAVEMDADLSHNPAYLADFFHLLAEGYDLVIGSRYVPGGSIPEWSTYRRFMSRSMNSFVRLLLGLKAKDCTSGFRAYSAGALRRIDLVKVQSDGYAFQVEMTLRCQQAGLRLCEVPITFVDRRYGKSKLSSREKWRFLKSVVGLALG